MVTSYLIDTKVAARLRLTWQSATARPVKCFRFVTGVLARVALLLPECSRLLRYPKTNLVEGSSHFGLGDRFLSRSHKLADLELLHAQIEVAWERGGCRVRRQPWRCHAASAGRSRARRACARGCNAPP